VEEISAAPSSGVESGLEGRSTQPTQRTNDRQVAHEATEFWYWVALLKLGDHIASAIARAAESEEIARQEIDEAVKARHLQLAEAWRHVADSYEFVLKLEEFLLDAHKSGGPVSLDQLRTPPKQRRT
jgi:hypothetical protein